MNATILPGPGAKSRAPRTREGDGHSIQSVDRALFLLETIAEAGGEATLTDLANRTGLNISTCHHLLATLIHRGFAAALQGDSVVTLSVREARHAVRVDTGKIGKVEAPHATSVGKAILAWLPEDEIKRILASGMKRFTDKTITELPALLESLRIVRRNGYAIDREEYLPGVICVGAAIRDQAGTVIGAISASTPTMRASDEHIALMREQITAAARGLSAEFGEPGSQNGERPHAAAN
jgi:IclR family acetate operon transcriptional repressor